MKRSRFGEEQIIGILRENDAGATVADPCRRHGMSSVARQAIAKQSAERGATFYAWKAKYGGMDGEPCAPLVSSTMASDARRLKALEDENAKPKRLYADAMLDNAGLKALLSEKW